MKKAEEKPAVEMTVGGKPKSGASHPPWKSLRDSHIPTARRLLYIFKTFARKEPSSAIASGYGFRLILRLEKTLALAADHGPRRVRLASPSLSHASSHFVACVIPLLVQSALRCAICTVRATTNFFSASNIHEINHSQRLSPRAVPSCVFRCGFFMLGCHAATEKSFRALSHEMQFFTAASSVTDRNFLLNRGAERGG